MGEQPLQGEQLMTWSLGTKCGLDLLFYGKRLLRDVLDLAAASLSLLVILECQLRHHGHTGLLHLCMLHALVPPSCCARCRTLLYSCSRRSAALNGGRNREQLVAAIGSDPMRLATWLSFSKHDLCNSSDPIRRNRLRIAIYVAENRPQMKRR